MKDAKKMSKKIKKSKKMFNFGLKNNFIFSVLPIGSTLYDEKHLKKNRK